MWLQLLAHHPVIDGLSSMGGLGEEFIVCIVSQNKAKDNFNDRPTLAGTLNLLTRPLARVRMTRRKIITCCGEWLLKPSVDQPQPGDTFPVHMGWTLPDGHRLQVTFEAQVEALELDKNRMRCLLLRVQAANGSQPESEVDSYYFDRVMELVGKRALIPLDALQSVVLPLRLATLTGEHPFFSDWPPYNRGQMTEHGSE
jgi:hypothetical protein